MRFDFIPPLPDRFPSLFLSFFRLINYKIYSTSVIILERARKGSESIIAKRNETRASLQRLFPFISFRVDSINPVDRYSSCLRPPLSLSLYLSLPERDVDKFIFIPSYIKEHRGYSKERRKRF